MEQSLTITVRDERDKPYRLELCPGRGVKIHPPAAWKTSPVPLAELRRALTTLEAVADDCVDQEPSA